MITFPHTQSAHCESGVAANMFTYAGISISEAMVFGLGGGLFFGYLPFIRINGLPLVTYRGAAGGILKQLAKIPGTSLYQKKYKDKTLAVRDLDSALAAGIPVGLQTGVFWLPYFPKALRFHFNAHNLVVYGKDGDDYLISDPVFPAPVRCAGEDLLRARFASGALAPKGKMYYFKQVPDSLDKQLLIRQGIKNVCRAMLASPFPLIGVKGIRFMSRRLVKWPEKLGQEQADVHLGHVVRMQEEIGTGGGGFRFMYAAFLQEAGNELSEEFLVESGKQLTEVGDLWRQFAAMAARICKKRSRPDDTYAAMSHYIDHCARLEENVFNDLENWVKGK
jgi:hypothetical protein